MTPRFVYFDLGRVLLDFSVAQMCDQVAQTCGIEPDRVHEALFAGNLLQALEMGRLDEEAFYRQFCGVTGARPERAELRRAASDIFTEKEDVRGIVSALAGRGVRLGILSNTCHSHWEHCIGRFAWLGEAFLVHALSFRLGVMKPDAAIFHRAADLAGVAAEEVFFCDDIEANAAGARAAGFDAVQFQSADQLAAELRARRLLA